MSSRVKLEPLNSYNKINSNKSKRFTKNELLKSEYISNSSNKDETHRVNPDDKRTSFIWSQEIVNGMKKADLSSLTSNAHLSRKHSFQWSNEIMRSSRQATKKLFSSPIFKSNREKIAEISKLRKLMRDQYLKTSTRKNIIEKWRTCIGLIQNIDIKCFIIALKALGDIYVEFEDYNSAKNMFFCYKILSFRLEMLEEVMCAYESLGNVYKFLFQYNKAIKCYKKVIELAWILDNKTFELRAYDNIGLQYFYLGNKEKARYYHERMIHGRSESDAQDSETKQNVITHYKQKNYHLFQDNQIIKQHKSNDELKEDLK